MEGVHGNTAYAAAGAAANAEDMMSAIEAISIEDESEEELDDQMSMSIAGSIASITSCAAAMDRKDLEEEVIKLRAQLVLAASHQKKTKQAKTELHDKVLQDTSGIMEKINSIDMYSLWWVEQALNERKISFDFKHSSFASYKQYVWRSDEKQKAKHKAE
jgi:hypothetical protein